MWLSCSAGLAASLPSRRSCNRKIGRAFKRLAQFLPSNNHKHWYPCSVCRKSPTPYFEEGQCACSKHEDRGLYLRFRGRPSGWYGQLAQHTWCCCAMMYRDPHPQTDQRRTAVCGRPIFTLPVHPAAHPATCLHLHPRLPHAHTQTRCPQPKQPKPRTPPAPSRPPSPPFWQPWAPPPTRIMGSR
jgi:hypothetical protein